MAEIRESVRLFCELIAMLISATPFLIVDDLKATIDFYQSKLGFSVPYKGGGNGEIEDHWAFVGRDKIMLMFKAIASDVHPQPNSARHTFARWDVYVYTDDPDSLYAECVAKGVPMLRALGDTSDGLRAFEVKDNNGYVLCFGRPIDRETTES
jgi:catechol 2,3-dioxygenase-like lactoylglutathione lyase family enzyme